MKKKKIKKREYGRNRHQNMLKVKKQKLKEYQKNYRQTKKSQFSGQQNSLLIIYI